jgi:two-component system OmpR family sensor kinase
MGAQVNYSGLIIAGIGFFLTRFTVTLAIYDDPLRFYLAGVVPLALGLGLAAFGMALAVADVRVSLVRTTALWCVVGAGTMLVLVVLTLLGSTEGAVDFSAARSQTYLSNFLIGGSVGGTLTGLYAARNRQQRSALEQQANRLVTLNRILRHEVLNAVTAIRGWVKVDPNEHPQAMEVIDDRSNDIQQTIEEIKYLTRRTGGDGASRTPLSLRDTLTESVETVSERHPDASLSVESIPDDITVRANERLSQVFTQLLENAIVHGEDESPDIDVSTTPTSVTVSLSDDGPGLPENQQTLLETGDIEEFDDPTTGFGLNVVRLLVESSGGRIETTVDDGTTIGITLSRAESDRAGGRPNRRELTGVRPLAPHLVVSFGAALIAGVPYGIVSEILGGSVAGIGVFYGTPDVVVGWLTHEFHSVVFGFVYVGLLSVALDRYQNSLRTYVAVGVVWCLVLWSFAAGVIAPVWLRLLGIPASIPNFSGRLLGSHLAWGLTLSVLTALGYHYVTPWLDRMETRLRKIVGEL